MPRWYQAGIRAARALSASAEEAQLALLVERVGTEIDRYRDGELSAFDVDQILFQYSRAAKALWKFCNLVDVQIAAQIAREQAPTDWWERGAPRKG